MSAARPPRMAAKDRRAAVLDTACRVFSRSSYRGATTAEIARESGVTEPVLYRHFPSKRELYLACLAAGWERVRTAWDAALAAESDPKEWVGSMGRAYFHLQDKADKIELAELWIHSLTEAGCDPKIRRALRDQMREVHAYVVDVIERSQAAGGVINERDAEAEAWIFIAIGLLGSIDRGLGIVGEQRERVFTSRRTWMIGN